LAGAVGFLRNHKDPESGSSVHVVDDGRVCYAYFLSPDGQIVGDVWLYNRCEAPVDPEWTDRAKAPYANPHGYARNPPSFQLPQDETDIVVRWRRDEQGKKIADILARDVLIGRLHAGQKPGWARAARKDGPLAKVLENAGEMGTRGKDLPWSHDH
jgi:hypothetical protein